VKAILLFDIDNTLIKPSNSHKQAFHEGFSQAFGIQGNVETVNPHGKTDRQIIADVLAQNGVDAGTAAEGIETCINVMTAAFFRLVKQENLQVLDGVFELLDVLSSKPVATGLVTGNLESIAWEKLNRAGLKRYFSFGGFGSDHPVRSKLVDIACERARKLNAHSASAPVLLIGDTPRDIAAGREAGVQTLAVATGIYTEEELARHGPDYALTAFRPTERFIHILDGLTT
jgi:phosphoglycolate phosphatase-like HAD superfamily hydrolase